MYVYQVGLSGPADLRLVIFLRGLVIHKMSVVGSIFDVALTTAQLQKLCSTAHSLLVRADLCFSFFS